MEDHLNGAHREVVRLWRWHLLEAYEHRHVCHDVFHAITGSYFLRVCGLVYQLIHLGGFTSKVRRHLHARVRKSMSSAEGGLQICKEAGKSIVMAH